MVSTASRTRALAGSSRVKLGTSSQIELRAKIQDLMSLMIETRVCFTSMADGVEVSRLLAGKSDRKTEVNVGKREKK